MLLMPARSAECSGTHAPRQRCFPMPLRIALNASWNPTVGGGSVKEIMRERIRETAPVATTCLYTSKLASVAVNCGDVGVAVSPRPRSRHSATGDQLVEQLVARPPWIVDRYPCVGVSC